MIFDFVDYQLNLKDGKVRPTHERWETLNGKIQKLLSKPPCPVQHLIALIRVTNSYRKTSSPRLFPYEIDTAALEGGG